MKCRACGYVSFEERETCPRCGGAPGVQPPAAGTGAGAPGRPRRKRRPSARRRAAAEIPAPAEAPGLEPEQLEFRVADLPQAGGGGGDFVDTPELDVDENLPDFDSLDTASVAAEGLGPLFSLDDDLIPPPPPGGEAAEEELHSAFRLPGDDAPPRGGAIIDRDEAVPEEFWAAEGAGLVRRAGAAAADAIVLALALALFVAGAWSALRVAGLDPDRLLRTAVVDAVALPFAVLGLILSLAYSVGFHAASGRTPGKRLARLEVRAVEGGALSASRCLVRWCAAVLGLAAAGMGVAWALFEPRRRGWADLASGTVVAERTAPAEPASEGSAWR